MLGILALATVLGGGAYVLFGAGGPALSADHDAVTSTLDLGGTICCIEHHEVDGHEFLFITAQEPRGFLIETNRDITLRVIALSDGTMEEVATLDAPLESHLPQSTAMVGSTLYVPLGISNEEDHAVWMIDVADPENPAEIGLYSGEDYITSLSSVDDLLVAHAHGVFRFYDASVPGEPDLRGEFRQPVSAVQRMVIDPDNARLYDREVRSNRIRISDVSELGEASPLGRHLNLDHLGRSQMRHRSVIGSAEERLETTAPARHYQDFAVTGDVLYIAASDLGLEIVDVSDPTAPETLDRIRIDGRAVRTAIAGERLYVVSVDEHSRERLAYEVHVYDIGDPAAPALVSTVDDIQAAPGRQAIETGGGHVFLGLNDTAAMIDAGS
jgi:hypothetical protein